MIVDANPASLLCSQYFNSVWSWAAAFGDAGEDEFAFGMSEGITDAVFFSCITELIPIPESIAFSMGLFVFPTLEWYAVFGATIV